MTFKIKSIIRSVLLALLPVVLLAFMSVGRPLEPLLQQDQEPTTEQQAPKIEVQRSIAPETWRKLTTDEDFSYKDEVEHEKVKRDNNGNFFLARLIGKIIRFIAFSSGRYIVWSIVIVFVLFILYKIITSKEQLLFLRARKKRGAKQDENASEDWLSTDWKSKLALALNKNDTEEAVRVMYMWLLQILQNKDLIKFTDDKTNRDYFYELSQSGFQKSFRSISTKYEYVHYGKYPISSGDFNELLELFNQTKAALNP